MVPKATNTIAVPIAVTPSNVLVPCGGKWVGRVLHLKDAMRSVPALCNGKLLVADRATLTPAGCFADGAFVVPAIADERYVSSLLQICHDHAVRVIVPLIDLDLERLAPHLDEFAAIGTTVVCSPPELVDLCLDKTRFAAFARDQQLEHPPLYEFNELTDDLFPVFAKRSRGFGSIGSIICRSRADAVSAFARDPSLVFQKYIEAPEVSIDAYIARTGKCIVRVPRVRDQVTGGEAHQSHTIRSAQVTGLADRTIEALALRGIRGPLNIQLFMTDPPSLIEVNTRLGSGSVLANQAVGGRLYSAVLQEACGEAGSGDPDDYQENLWMYRYFGDVFHDGKQALRILPNVVQDN